MIEVGAGWVLKTWNERNGGSNMKIYYARKLLTMNLTVGLVGAGVGDSTVCIMVVMKESSISIHHENPPTTMNTMLTQSWSVSIG